MLRIDTPLHRSPFGQYFEILVKDEGHSCTGLGERFLFFFQKKIKTVRLNRFAPALRVSPILSGQVEMYQQDFH